MPISPFDHLPVVDPGQPDLRTVPRFLWWIAKNQKRIILTGTFFGVINLLCVALMPGILGRGIQAIADEKLAELQSGSHRLTYRNTSSKRRNSASSQSGWKLDLCCHATTAISCEKSG